MPPSGAARTRHPHPASRSAPTLVIVGQTSARFTSPSPTRRLMEDSRCGCRHAPRQCFLHLPSVSLLMSRCYPPTFHVFEQMRQSVLLLLLKDHSTESFHSFIFRHSCEDQSMTSPISEVCNITRDSSMCTNTDPRASQAQLNTTLCSDIGMERNNRLCCRHDGTREQPVSLLFPGAA